MMSDDQRTLQVSKERGQREAALGKRARAVLRGDLGPVLQRWVSGSVGPVSARLRMASDGILKGNHELAHEALSSPLFGLPSVSGSTATAPILQWALRGSSPGKGSGSTYADDLVLAVLGTAITRCASSKVPLRLTTVVMACAEAARETAMGQFITQVQGAKAMMRVRRGGKAGWAQGKQLSDVANLLAGQVRTALDAPNVPSSEMAPDIVPVGGREVVSVFTLQGEWRRIELRRPEAGDWDLLDLARHPRGEKDANATTWASFAMMILCAAQAEAGWFDLVKLETRNSGEMSRREGIRKRSHKAAHGIVLAEGAHAAIKGDLKRWLSLGFIAEPMLTVPESGDYLTVKHRSVAGGRGPMGVKTDAKESAAWVVASGVMAATPWTVCVDTLRAIRSGGPLAELAEKCEPNEVRRAAILDGYSGLAPSEFYFPIFMDFRGRAYTRPNLVTYQGSDLQKGLLCFPKDGHDVEPHEEDHIALHLAALYGGPDKLDKATLRERRAWYEDQIGHPSWDRIVSEADEPVQLWSAMSLLNNMQGNRIACQIDGTCNGLQHLTALFRDETAAPFVNLVASTYNERPSDIYAEVAQRVALCLRTLAGLPTGAWARRVLAAIKIDRKLCKKPVMVLPYGGTKVAIEDAVLGAILEQGDLRTPEGFCPWTECLTFVDGGWVRDQEAVAGNYLAFRDRELRNHPLLHLDAKRLGTLVWQAIEQVIPRPMQAMQAFRDVAKSVGGLSLEWSTGFSLVDDQLFGEHPPLWVVQAKAKSQKSQLRFKGMHLPNSVRGLSLRVGADEVDPGAHTSGIVANFIHSQDASHLARTMRLFGRPCFGAIHDCLITRPSLMDSLGGATRKAFYEQYALGNPLDNPVRLRNITTGVIEFEGTWWTLAEQASAVFPERGCWEPSEVLHSAWFFS